MNCRKIKEGWENRVVAMKGKGLSDMTVSRDWREGKEPAMWACKERTFQAKEYKLVG